MDWSLVFQMGMGMGMGMGTLEYRLYRVNVPSSSSIAPVKAFCYTQSRDYQASGSES